MVASLDTIPSEIAVGARATVRSMWSAGADPCNLARVHDAHHVLPEHAKTFCPRVVWQVALPDVGTCPPWPEPLDFAVDVGKNRKPSSAVLLVPDVCVGRTTYRPFAKGSGVGRRAKKEQRR